MNKQRNYQILLGISALCLLIGLVVATVNEPVQSGPFIIGFFVALAIGIRGYVHLQGYTYTIMIFGAVAASLYYPDYFLEVGGYQLSG